MEWSEHWKSITKIHVLMNRFILKIRKILNVGNPDYIKSYSQCGEDLIIKYIFSLKGIKFPTYIDVGAYHPTVLSNTALFYDLGSRGINIEPNLSLYKIFLKKRKFDLNLNIGVGEKFGESLFYEMEDSTLSTFSESEFNMLYNYGARLKKINKIPLFTLNEILINNCISDYPDFLTIDAEGLDFLILKDFDFHLFGLKVICVESRNYSPSGFGDKRNDLINLIIKNGYFEYADTGLNSIFVLKKFWFDK